MKSELIPDTESLRFPRTRETRLSRGWGKKTEEMVVSQATE